MIVRSSSRFVTTSPGVTTRHCFSSGAHYDPANVSFGPLIACDEHVVEGGAGFAAHRHRGVLLLSWVLSGSLLHTSDGVSQVIRPGAVQVSATGGGIVHAEQNASTSEPLRFLQFWVLSDAPDSYAVEPPPVVRPGVRFDVLSGTARLRTQGYVFAMVASGQLDVDGAQVAPGDSLRLVDPDVAVTGDGQLVALTMSRPTVEG